MAWMPKKLKFKRIVAYLPLITVFFLFLPLSVSAKARHLLSSFFAPLTSVLRDATLEVTQGTSDLTSSDVSAEKYRLLHEEYIRLNNQVANMQSQIDIQAEKINILSGLKQEFGIHKAKFAIADVIAADSDTKKQIYIINVGSDLGVKVGQLVLAGIAMHDSQLVFPNDAYKMSVVGQILEVGKKTSNFRLISDMDFKLPVKIFNNLNTDGIDGSLRGQGLKPMDVKMVSGKSEISPGDLVFVKPNIKTLPVKMLIGPLTSCQRDEDSPMMWKISVAAPMDLHKLRQVVIVMPTEYEQE
ncbi:MAG: rod shape-determining protein MreC [Phycisphaerae bacterium]|nr:rod shape-determining protein MreC [Phycisphaerae bacterium]